MKVFSLFAVKVFLQVHQYSSLHVCIIGSGPAGFYCAQRLLKNLPSTFVDVFEKYPVPFGLVRFGVAPDHPEVKNVINTFNKTASSPFFRFVGNVTLGRDIFLKELRNFYNVVVLTYGADNDVKLKIPGEELNNVISARKFVGWYNGLPELKNLSIDLGNETAVVLGQGNVALDVSRILLKSSAELKNTDIPEHVLCKLAESNVKHVYTVGRRGPLQVAFTIKEFREMINLPNVQTVISQEDVAELNVSELSRPRKRLTELMLSVASSKNLEESKKYFHVKFLRSPLKIIGNTNVEGVEFSINHLNTVDDVAEVTNKREFLKCGLVFRSIGYKRISVDPDISVDMLNHINGMLPGVYSAGWLSTGPIGVILSTMSNSFAVGDLITKDIEVGKIDLSLKSGYLAVEALLKERGVCIVDWHGWKKIDSAEITMGKSKGKPREKIVDIDKMLQVASQ